MMKKNEYIGHLSTTELQFRLASAVQLAVTMKNQPLDLPQTWSHGKHITTYAEVALRHDQAEFASTFMHRSATYMMAIAILKAIIYVVKDPKNDSSFNIQSAYQIARLIRNAFAHNPYNPVWSLAGRLRFNCLMVMDIK